MRYHADIDFKSVGWLTTKLLGKKKGRKRTTGWRRMYPAPDISTIPNVLSYHLWLLYMTPQFFDKKSNKLSGDGDANGVS